MRSSKMFRGQTGMQMANWLSSTIPTAAIELNIRLVTLYIKAKAGSATFVFLHKATGSPLSITRHCWMTAGFISLIDLSGHVNALTPEWESADGLAWSADGKEVWFTAAEKGLNRDLYGGKYVWTNSENPRSAGGHDFGGHCAGRPSTCKPGCRTCCHGHCTAGTARPWIFPGTIGILLRTFRAMASQSSSKIPVKQPGPHYSLAIRKIDGTPPVQLGEGSAGSLSPDGKWAISILTGSNPTSDAGSHWPRPTSHDCHTGARCSERQCSFPGRWETHRPQRQRARPQGAHLSCGFRGRKASPDHAGRNYQRVNFTRRSIHSSSRRCRASSLSYERRPATPHPRASSTDRHPFPSRARFYSGPLVRGQLFSVWVSSREFQRRYTRST